MPMSSHSQAVIEFCSSLTDGLTASALNVQGTLTRPLQVVQSPSGSCLTDVAMAEMANGVVHAGAAALTTVTATTVKRKRADLVCYGCHGRKIKCDLKV